MSDRHRANRASLPPGSGYGSLYAGSDTAAARPYVATPRTSVTSTSAAGVPTTTRTYAVGPDNRQRSSARARRSTLDSSAERPPVIVTTTTTSSGAAPHKDRSHASSSATRAGSPVRHDDHRLYAQPASSIRSRSTARPYHVAAADDLGRFLSPREVDAYRSSRPSVVYPSDPRHSTAAVDYGDNGYQYTNAGELARYDLGVADRSSSRPSRQGSVDRGYYRPNVNYNADQRSFNVNTSHDLSRNYNMNTSRPYDGRMGPPPSTRGFGKIPRTFDPSRDPPPAAPLPPSPTVATQLDALSDRWDGSRRNRPPSLHQDASSVRSSHLDDRHDRHRSRDDDRHRSRDDDRRIRDDLDRFKDDSVTHRGFGIRTDAVEPSRDRRREVRTEEPIRRSDEFVPVEDRHERRESRHDDDGADRERPRLRDKVAAGLSVAATAVGLVPQLVKDDDKRQLGAREPRTRRSPDESRDWRKDPAELPAEHSPLSGAERERGRERGSSSRDESRLHPEAADRLWREPAEATERHRREPEIVDRHRRDPEAADRHWRETEAKAVVEAATSPSDSDDGNRASRWHQASTVFNPNDASDLKQLKEQLAALDVSDKGSEGSREKQQAGGDDRQPSSSPSPTNRRGSDDSSRGRELALTTATKQVRVVSPPRDKAEDRPLKGILKQPSASFPEDTNPIREGVAPHKEDKKLKEAPPGARWTKINREVVNPEALTVGKERFEVRDDFVIVLRVLSTEEIQAYAAATQVLRERRRSKADGDRERDPVAESGRRHHRHWHRGEDEREGERERRRRHRRDGDAVGGGDDDDDDGDDDDDDYDYDEEHESRVRDAESRHPRSYRERERAHEV
ncbi:hypothetical protein XA68_14269 [Ophiocordyceps unilateralis]|uniref:DUF8035 domain-containing protein n=1 Tax=Ophiocordyceps unilateralis TaxID=268505 RepID=A0A2A9P9Y4_OPHUN|nr:hypothetical protein XA68_14269 [Ophiocordyceps unilateralis]